MLAAEATSSATKAESESKLREKEAEIEGHDGLSFSEGHWEWEE